MSHDTTESRAALERARAEIDRQEREEAGAMPEQTKDETKINATAQPAAPSPATARDVIEAGALAIDALLARPFMADVRNSSRAARDALRALSAPTLTLAEGPGEAGAEAIVHACNESAAIDLIAAVTETSEETVREAVGRVGLPQVATNAENVAREIRAERDRLKADLAAAEKARDEARAILERTAHALDVTVQHVHTLDERARSVMAAWNESKAERDGAKHALEEVFGDAANLACAVESARHTHATVLGEAAGLEGKRIELTAALASANARVAALEGDRRINLRWGVEARTGSLMSAHFREEWAKQETERCGAAGGMVVDLFYPDLSSPAPALARPGVARQTCAAHSKSIVFDPSPDAGKAGEERDERPVSPRARLIFEGAVRLATADFVCESGQTRMPTEAYVARAAALLDAVEKEATR